MDHPIVITRFYFEKIKLLPLDAKIFSLHFLTLWIFSHINFSFYFVVERSCIISFFLRSHWKWEMKITENEIETKWNVNIHECICNFSLIRFKYAHFFKIRNKRIYLYIYVYKIVYAYMLQDCCSIYRNDVSLNERLFIFDSEWTPS